MLPCYNYSLVNSGSQLVNGSYKLCGSNEPKFFECPPFGTIHFGCCAEDSIVFDMFSRQYAAMYCTLHKAPGVCSGADPLPGGCNLEIEEVLTTPTNRLTDPMGNNGTATINHIGDDGAEVEFSVNGLVWQDSNYFEGLGAAFSRGDFLGASRSTNYTAYVRKKADHTCKATKAFTIANGPAPLFASAVVTKQPTSPGAADGVITVSAYSGSGNYTVMFAHDGLVHNMAGVIIGSNMRSMDKTGLPAGDYHITVTDIVSNQTQEFDVSIADPAPVPVVVEHGDYFEIPYLNSITFVDERFNEPQRPGNRLLENQYYPGIDKTCYFQKIIKDDFRTTQFRTNFANFIADLHVYPKGVKVKSFPPPVLREKNVGKLTDYAIRISNDSLPNHSRISFPGGPPPVDIGIDQPFEILNSEGYDGVYIPVTMNVDESTGFEYIVIAKTWPFNVDVSSINATGRFSTSAVNFDIYECVHTFIDVPDGLYQIRMVAFDDNGQQERWSEPIDLRVEHKDTNVFNYANVDNKFNMNFSHGYVGAMRIESTIGHKSFIGGEQQFNENADTSLTLVSAKANRLFDLETYALPPYMNDKLGLMMRLDYWTINGVEYKAQEGFGAPQYLFRSLLADTTTRIRENKWMEDYNGDDLGTVVEGKGYIISNGGGYIKR